MKARVLLLCLLASPVLAAGFRVDTQASRATGMGTAVTGLVDDASAVFYNPAALTLGGQGFEVLVGDTLIIPQLKFTGADGTTTNSSFDISPPPHLFARVGILDQLALGIGVFTPFGARGNWPEDWPGQFRARQSSLQTFAFNANLAYRPLSRLSLAVGISAVRGTVFIERHLDFVDSIGSVELGGAAWGIGFNGAVQAEIIEQRLFIGAQVRSQTQLDFKGNAHFEGIPTEFQARIYDQPITAKVALPLTASFGLGFKPLDTLRFGVDVNYVDWSSFRELRIEFTNPDLTVPLQKNWFDTASVHVGGEYDVNDMFQVRLGFVYDPTPSPSNTLTPDLPDATRLKVAAGLGFHHSSGFRADLGFQFVALLSQPSSAPGLPGTYSGTAEVISLTVGYRFPMAKSDASPPPADPPPTDPAAATPETAPAPAPAN